MTRAWEVFRFELDYQSSRVSTRIYLLLFLGLTAAMATIFFFDARDDGYHFNAPIIVAAVTILSSMISLLVVAGVAGDAATRDAQTRIDSLLYTTPLRKTAYLGGRFLGAFAVTALLLLAVPAGLLVAAMLPGIERELLGPFRADTYWTAYTVFALPNAFVATAVLFGLAAVTGRVLAAYAGAIFLFASAFVSESFVSARLGQWGLGKLLDPMGYTTLLSFWRSSNRVQKNTLLVGFDGAMLSNRLLWLGIGLSILAFACLRFRFGLRWQGQRSSSGDYAAAVQTRWSVTMPEVRRAFGIGTRLRQLRAVVAESVRELHRSRAWLIVPLMAVLFIMTGAELLEVELGTPGAATTGRVASMYGASENALLFVLLIVLSAGELFWREREARMHSIADAAPLPEWLSFLGKFLGLSLMIAIAQAVLLGAGVIVQLMEGVYDIDLLLYVKILFGFQLIGFLLLAAAAMVVHVLVNQKYVANVVAMVLYLSTMFLPELGVEHNLLLYGHAPDWSYSEMSGFGLHVGPWLWFTLYWSGWALLFGLGAYLFWIRGEERGLRKRLALARGRLTRWPALAGAASLAMIAGIGGYIFYNTNVLNRYLSDTQIEQQRAGYERRYGRFASLPQPTLAATKLEVDFHPQRAAATIRGSYRLENRTGAPIDAIHLVLNPDVETKNVSFDRAARLTHTDDGHGYRIYALGQPIPAGDSIRMNFELVFAPRGFTNDGRSRSVLPNGSWFQHRADHRHSDRQWLPFVGYQTSRELTYAAHRKRHGLPERPPFPTLDNVAMRQKQQGHEQIEFEAIVSTDADQVGVAPGALRRMWKENGRSYAHYVADAPITNSYAIYSARYAVQKAKWRDVDIEIFHHPSHTANLDNIVRSVRASLDYHTRHFSPYPYRQLRVVEYPSSARGMGLTSFPGLIEYSEGFAMVRPEADPRGFDFPFAIMAHEMGHQWWGHQIVPARVEGAALLSESLAWYSAMLTVEETYGRDHFLRLLKVMRAEFLGPQVTRDEPLLRAVDRFGAYRIGPMAMYTMREAAGADRINGALRNLLARFDPARPPYPTSLDLYAELRAITPPDKHALLEDLFEEITFWDLRTKRADVQPGVSGGHRVTVLVDATKLKGDGTGKERPVPMDDTIEIAVFDDQDKALYRAPHRIRSGEQTFTIDVPRKPARVTVDPDQELFDRRPEDNTLSCAP